MYGQHGRQRHLDKLEISGLEFPLYANTRIAFFDLHDNGGVRPAQQLSQDNASLGIAVVIGLQAGEDQVELLIFYRGCESTCHVDSIESDKARVFEVNGPIGALGQSFAEHLLRVRWASGDDNDLAAVLFFLTQSLLKRVRVRFVDLIGHIFANPGAGFVQLQWRVLLRHLFHANQDLQQQTPCILSCQSRQGSIKDDDGSGETSAHLCSAFLLDGRSRLAKRTENRELALITAAAPSRDRKIGWHR